MKNILKKIFGWIASIPHDKLLHLLFGLLIFLYLEPFVGKWIAFTISVGCGFLKDLVIDKWIGGTVDWKDILVTSVGSMLGLLSTLI